MQHGVQTIPRHSDYLHFLFIHFGVADEAGAFGIKSHKHEAGMRRRKGGLLYTWMLVSCTLLNIMMGRERSTELGVL